MTSTPTPTATWTLTPSPTATPTPTAVTFTWSELVRGTGSASRFNAVVVNLDGTGLTDSQRFANYVCGQALTDPAGGTCLGSVQRWDATSSPPRFIGYTPGIGDPPFAITPGQVLFIALRSTAPSSFTLQGSYPAPGTVRYPLVRGSGSSCRYNYLSIPFDAGMPTDAEQLAISIGNGTASNVGSVARWNAAGAPPAFLGYTPGIGDPPFAVQAGHPYFVCARANAKAVWP